MARGHKVHKDVTQPSGLEGCRKPQRLWKAGNSGGKMTPDRRRPTSRAAHEGNKEAFAGVFNNGTLNCSVPRKSALRYCSFSSTLNPFVPPRVSLVTCVGWTYFSTRLFR